MDSVEKVMGIPVVGREVYKPKKEASEELNLFLKGNENLTSHFVGYLRLSLPNLYDEVALSLIQFLTLEGHHKCIYAYHLPMLNHFRRGQDFSFPYFLVSFPVCLYFTVQNEKNLCPSPSRLYPFLVKRVALDIDKTGSLKLALEAYADGTGLDSEEEESSDDSDSQDGDSDDDQDEVEVVTAQNLKDLKSKQIPCSPSNTKGESSKQDVLTPINAQLEQHFEAMGHVGLIKGENHLARMVVDIEELKGDMWLTKSLVQFLFNDWHKMKEQVEEVVSIGQGGEIEVLKANFGAITKEMDQVKVILHSYMEWSIVMVKSTLQHLQTLGQLTNTYCVMDSQGRKRKATPDGFDLGSLAVNIEDLVKEWAKVLEGLEKSYK
ncbi:hypothetical protein KI387_031288 [Taxus chinensis]|uniref:Uncharacterized protein n=1 Tax=Taxus chinensis TaxID=29808 RepID=A0AA38FFQ1_TAXCH|nr:hypothetical protein KI387_031288 [Taxus chinensis]